MAPLPTLRVSLGLETGVLLVLLAVAVLAKRLLSTPRDPLRSWVGPVRDSFILGNMRKTYASANGHLQLAWARQYGGAVRYWGPFQAGVAL